MRQTKHVKFSSHECDHETTNRFWFLTASTSINYRHRFNVTSVRRCQSSTVFATQYRHDSLTGCHAVSRHRSCFDFCGQKLYDTVWREMPRQSSTHTAERATQLNYTNIALSTSFCGSCELTDNSTDKYLKINSDRVRIKNNGYSPKTTYSQT